MTDADIVAVVQAHIMGKHIESRRKELPGYAAATDQGFPPFEQGSWVLDSSPFWNFNEYEYRVMQ